MRGHFACCAAMLAAIITSAATAALQPAGKREARVQMRAYGECLIKKAETAAAKQALKVILVKPDGTLTPKQFESLRLLNCLDNDDAAFGYVSQLTFQASLLRGALFRAMYLSRTKPKAAFAPADLAVAWTEADPARRVSQRFGDCVVALDLEGAERAITASPTTPPENEAYAALAPALDRCVVEGATIKFSKSVLEGVLAEALYKKAAGIAAAAG